MRTEEPRALRVVEGPLARREWYRRLARLLTAAPATASAVLEWCGERPVPWVVVRPASLLEAIEAPGVLSGFALERPAAVPSAPRPPTGWHVCYGLLWPTAPDLSRDGSGLDACPAEPIDGADTWIGGQTFWAPATRGRLRVAARFAVAAPTGPEAGRRREVVGARLASVWGATVGTPFDVARPPCGTGADWRRGSGHRLPSGAWVAREAERVALLAEPVSPPRSPRPFDGPGHGIVFGSSGAGKTTFLAGLLVASVDRGDPVVVIDLHGDLTPAVVDGLSPEGRRRVVAMDVTDRPVPGVAALSDRLPDDRAVAHLVAALKRLSPDGSELHWGFRLERIFDSFARLALEGGGSLLDVYALLTDAARRDSARLATRRPDLARFLEELEPIVRRTPDFLWPAATRLSKVVLLPALAELLSPADGGVPVEELLEAGRSLLVRLPFAAIGPEAASFAGTLVLARTYLGVAAARSRRSLDRPILFVLDEVQSFAPRLVSELFAESRKFGVRLIAATQFPERLAPELKSATIASVAHVASFRVPPASASLVGAWLGLLAPIADQWLPVLPTGHAVVRDPEMGSLRSVRVEPPPAGGRGGSPWPAALVRTREEFGTVPLLESGPGDENVARLLLTVFAADEQGSPARPETLLAKVREVTGAAGDAADLLERLPLSERHGWVVRSPSGLHLTLAGERELGLRAPSGATRESSEHRALLAAAFRILARRGALPEVVRQGRFDTTLPDGLLRQLRPLPNGTPPVEVARALDAARSTWAWRFFGGRDVHLEAEVSGALRPERIRRGLAKARARGAYVLFLVSDAARSRRVSATLRAAGAGRDVAQVWTLPVFGRPPTVSPGPG